ncbi:MAG TPA: radical SAM protein [Nitrospirota bacterium]|nr:radical SAM protein [Nitrospirota bacterium]
MTSKVLIISTNREFSPQPVAPVGAAWIAEALHQAGLVTALIDLSFEKDPLKKLTAAIKSFEPDGIGLSVRNVDNGDFLCPRSFLPELKELTDHIKSICGARILIGGSGVSIMPRRILEYLDLDYAVTGEGEVAAVSFFKAGREEDFINTPGIVCRKVDEQATERMEWLVSPDLVRPNLHKWVDVRRYLRYEPVLPIQGKRGCANRCLYCTYNRIEGRTYRLREPSAVVEEISGLMLSTGARTFEFVDSIFNQPEGYMEALLEEIIRWKLKARFHVSSMSPKGLTKQQVSLMERAGITAVGITPEAASDVTLSSLKKGFTESDVHRAADMLAGSKIKALWCFLLGGPGEDEDTIKKTLGFINKKLPSKDKAFITIGIRVYPYTGMHRLAVEEGVVGGKDPLLMPAFYFSDRLSPDHARAILAGGLNDIGRVIFLSDTNFPSLGALRYIGSALRLPSPFWSYAGYMNMLISGRRVIRREWPR